MTALSKEDRFQRLPEIYFFYKKTQLTQADYLDNIVDELVEQRGRFSERISKRDRYINQLHRNNLNVLITRRYAETGLAAAV